MSDLVEFLRARLDEDEELARAAAVEWNLGDMVDVRREMTDDVYDHVVTHTPARMLREVEAKRRLMDLADSQQDNATMCDYFAIDAEDTYRLLALPYADHPDYRQEWAP